ncbi:acyl carrier protein [Streptomyces sp. Rer75]|uniref:acyl carrier protein n=1 Tax=unclassified Streptomyces TaxID=2593676 RepID=UPI0015D0497D|nr:acyl carrier protein [Streptomyces sp. Rer75]QLH25026.1 acyl carrier protein [Streptomyces sp. Rer75]
MSRTEKIQQYIEERFLVEFGGDLNADTDLFKAGVIDSFGYIQLMNFLEDEFAFQMDEADILTDVFVSLSSIDDFVARKLAEPNPR